MRVIKKYVAVAIVMAVISAYAGAADDPNKKPEGDQLAKELAAGAALVSAAPENKNPDKPLYTVVDGTKVDNGTLQGFRAWRAAACERCHGANQAGLVGPSLLEALKRLTKEQFATAVLEGKPEKGMPGHKNMKTITENIDNLYGFLKGRSDGAIKAGRLEKLNP